jgi:hypothetical protein
MLDASEGASQVDRHTIIYLRLSIYDNNNKINGISMQGGII